MAMSHLTGTFISRSGYRLFEQSWQPTGVPHANIVLVHGLGEHSSRYAHVAAALTGRGYAVHTFDLMGHGRSEGERAYIDSFDQFADDLEQFARRVHRSAPDRPLILLGHSMGGAIVAYTTGTRLLPVAGAIYSSAALKPGSDISPLLMRAVGLLGRYRPHLPLTKLDSRAVSRDPAVVAAYAGDPLVHHGGVPARTGAELLRALRRIADLAETLRYPMLIFHGTADRLTDVEGSLQLYARAGSADKTLRLFDGFFHECLNEPEQAQVFELILDWLDAHRAADAP